MQPSIEEIHSLTKKARTFSGRESIRKKREIDILSKLLTDTSAPASDEELLEKIKSLTAACACIAEYTKDHNQVEDKRFRRDVREKNAIIPIIQILFDPSYAPSETVDPENSSKINKLKIALRLAATSALESIKTKSNKNTRIINASAAILIFTPIIGGSNVTPQLDETVLNSLFLTEEKTPVEYKKILRKKRLDSIEFTLPYLKVLSEKEADLFLTLRVIPKLISFSKNTDEKEEHVAAIQEVCSNIAKGLSLEIDPTPFSEDINSLLTFTWDHSPLFSINLLLLLAKCSGHEKSAVSKLNHLTSATFKHVQEAITILSKTPSARSILSALKLRCPEDTRKIIDLITKRIPLLPQQGIALMMQGAIAKKGRKKKKKTSTNSSLPQSGKKTLEHNHIETLVKLVKSKKGKEQTAAFNDLKNASKRKDNANTIIQHHLTSLLNHITPYQQSELKKAMCHTPDSKNLFDFINQVAQWTRSLKQSLTEPVFSGSLKAQLDQLNKLHSNPNFEHFFLQIGGDKTLFQLLNQPGLSSDFKQLSLLTLATLGRHNKEKTPLDVTPIAHILHDDLTQKRLDASGLFLLSLDPKLTNDAQKIDLFKEALNKLNHNTENPDPLILSMSYLCKHITPENIPRGTFKSLAKRFRDPEHSLAPHFLNILTQIDTSHYPTDIHGFSDLIDSLLAIITGFSTHDSSALQILERLPGNSSSCNKLIQYLQFITLERVLRDKRKPEDQWRMIRCLFILAKNPEFKDKFGKDTHLIELLESFKQSSHQTNKEREQWMSGLLASLKGSSQAKSLRFQFTQKKPPSSQNCSKGERGKASLTDTHDADESDHVQLEAHPKAP